MAKAKKARIPRRIVVPNVKVAKGVVQKVVFVWNKAKHRFVAKTNGFPPIRVAETDDGKFHAWNGAVDVKAPDARMAFAKAARQLWAA